MAELAQAAEVPAATSSAPLPAPQAVNDEDLPLVIQAQVNPKFSPSLFAQLGKGRVAVNFQVEPDGSVSHPVVVESSHERLNGPVLHALAQWKFEPLHHAQPGAVVLAFDVEQP
jgi:TonB family protein